jgi:DNA-binding transcriptional regulator YdaS (Cro superfamily)
MFDRIGIYERFKGQYPAARPIDLARLLSVRPQAVLQWKDGKRQVPWRRLKVIIDEQGICWDWLLEGKAPKYHRHGNKPASHEFDRHGINMRFLSLFPDMSQAKVAKELGVKQMSVYRWYHSISQVPWERLKYAVDTKGVTWEWLIEGR